MADQTYRLLELVATPRRLRLLTLLLRAPATEETLRDTIGGAPATVNRDIGVLRDAGLITNAGAMTPYVVVFPDQIRHLLDAAVGLHEAVLNRQLVETEALRESLAPQRLRDVTRPTE